MWECAMQLYYSRVGGATLAAEADWKALDDEGRAEFAREAIAIQREHSKTLSHLPFPSRIHSSEQGPLLSG